MVEVVDRLTRIAHLEPGASLQLLGLYNDEYAILTGCFQLEDTNVQPEFTTTPTSTYKYWLSENWLMRSIRKTYHPSYITSARSRCSSC